MICRYCAALWTLTVSICAARRPAVKRMAEYCDSDRGGTETGWPVRNGWPVLVHDDRTDVPLVQWWPVASVRCDSKTVGHLVDAILRRRRAADTQRSAMSRICPIDGIGAATWNATTRNGVRNITSKHVIYEISTLCWSHFSNLYNTKTALQWKFHFTLICKNTVDKTQPNHYKEILVHVHKRLSFKEVSESPLVARICSWRLGPRLYICTNDYFYQVKYEREHDGDKTKQTVREDQVDQEQIVWLAATNKRSTCMRRSGGVMSADKVHYMNSSCSSLHLGATDWSKSSLASSSSVAHRSRRHSVKQPEILGQHLKGQTVKLHDILYIGLEQSARQ